MLLETGLRNVEDALDRGTLVPDSGVGGKSREEVLGVLKSLPSGQALTSQIQKTFGDIVSQCLLEKRAF